MFECSPFHRCLETAKPIAKILNQNAVTISYEFAEFLASWQYKSHNPVEKITLRGQSGDKLKKEFGFAVSCDQEKMKMYSARFPETDDDCFERMKEGLKRIEGQYEL